MLLLCQWQKTLLSNISSPYCQQFLKTPWVSKGRKVEDAAFFLCHLSFVLFILVHCCPSRSVFGCMHNTSVAKQISGALYGYVAFQAQPCSYGKVLDPFALCSTSEPHIPAEAKVHTECGILGNGNLPIFSLPLPPTCNSRTCLAWLYVWITYNFLKPFCLRFTLKSQCSNTA